MKIRVNSTSKDDKVPSNVRTFIKDKDNFAVFILQTNKRFVLVLENKAIKYKSKEMEGPEWLDIVFRTFKPSRCRASKLLPEPYNRNILAEYITKKLRELEVDSSSYEDFEETIYEFADAINEEIKKFVEEE